MLHHTGVKCKLIYRAGVIFMGKIEKIQQTKYVTVSQGKHPGRSHSQLLVEPKKY